MPMLSNAWVFSAPKHAALYFDKCHFVAPALAIHEAEELKELASLSARYPFEVPGCLGRVDERMFVLGEIACKVQAAGVEQYMIEAGLPPLFKGRDLSHLDQEGLEAGLAIAYCEFAVQIGIAGPGEFVRPAEWAEAVAKEFTAHRPASPALTLSNIKLVDADALSWDQILDLRRDEASMRRLVQLRNFLIAERHDWSEERLAADLENRINGYQSAAKKHGLDLVDSGLTVFLGTQGWVAAAALFSHQLDLLPAALAAGPLVASVGTAILELRKARRNVEFIRRSDPVSYLIGLQEQVAK